jgi:hypothetical protein
MTAPSIGQKVKYLGATLVISEHYQEKPERLGRTGVVVPLFDAGGNDVEAPEGTWPVNVKWDNGDPVQTCFENEVEAIDNSEDSVFNDDESA